MAPRAKSATPALSTTSTSTTIISTKKNPAKVQKKGQGKKKATVAAVAATPAPEQQKTEFPLNTHEERLAAVAALGPPPLLHHNDSRQFQYAYQRAIKEDISMFEHAKALLLHGAVDFETARAMAKPWHVQGELSLKLDEKYVVGGVRDEGTEMPSERTADRKRKREDEKERKWLEDWEAGRIDDWGRLVGGEEKTENGKEKAVVVESEGEGGEQGREKRRKSSSPAPGDALKRVSSGRIEKAAKKKTTTTTTKTKTETEKGAKEKTRLPTIAEEEESPSSPNQPAPKVDAPDYAQYNYYELAAICRERTLASGGRVDALRARLMEDDLLVREGKERKNISKPAKKKGREFKTVAPDSAPGVKRKRCGNEEEGGEKKKRTKAE